MEADGARLLVRTVAAGGLSDLKLHRRARGQLGEVRPAEGADVEEELPAVLALDEAVAGDREDACHCALHIVTSRLTPPTDTSPGARPRPRRGGRAGGGRASPQS